MMKMMTGLRQVFVGTAMNMERMLAFRRSVVVEVDAPRRDHSMLH